MIQEQNEVENEQLPLVKMTRGSYDI